MHCDRWLAAPQWGLRHLLSWALQFGLDYFNVHTDFAADSSHSAQFEWYNLWAGAVKQPLSTPGAFVIFHDGLDASGQKLFDFSLELVESDFCILQLQTPEK